MELWQWHCRNWREKKNFAIGLWQCHCRNRGIKKNFSNCGNGIAENGGKKGGSEIYGRVKKKVSCLQYFYNIFTINYT